MTVEVFDPAPIYTVAGTGPYAIPHPYMRGAIKASVIVDGRVLPLTPDQFTVVPETSMIRGDIALSSDIAADHAGDHLLIERETIDEQGWVGLMGEREAGLENQLDRDVMAIQEIRRMAAASVRSIVPISPIVPRDGHVLMFDGDDIVPGPSAEDVVDAERFADRAEVAARRAEEAAEAAAAGVVPTLDSLTDLAISAGTPDVVIVGGRLMVVDPAGEFADADGRPYRIAGYATPAMFGVHPGPADQTAAVRAMLDLTTLHGIELRWSAGTYRFHSYNCPHAAPRVRWRSSGKVILESMKTAPAGPGFDVDYFIQFSAASKHVVAATANLERGASQITVASTAGISDGDLLLLMSSRTIETDHRGQARHGAAIPVGRLIDATTIELDRPVPFSAIVGSRQNCQVISRVSATELVVANMPSAVTRASARYRARWTTGAAVGVGSRIVDFDPGTMRMKFHTSGNILPASVVAGDLFTLEREVEVQVNHACSVDICGDFLLNRSLHLTATDNDLGFRGLRVTHAVGGQITGVSTRGFSECGIRLVWCYGLRVSRGKMDYCNRAWGGSDGTGYGVSVVQSHAVEVSHIQAYATRRVVDFTGTLGACYDCTASHITGYGNGAAYSGGQFWPAGTVGQSVAGSHGAAFRTLYQSISGFDTAGIMNCRGDAERIRNVFGTGNINYMVNAFQGDFPDVDGLYYRDMGHDWALALNRRLQPVQASAKLTAAVRIAGYSIIDSRVIKLRNVHLEGVAGSIIDINGVGRVGPIILQNIAAYVNDENGESNNGFHVIRSSGGSTALAGNVVMDNVRIFNNPSAPHSPLYWMRFSSFTQDHGYFVRTPCGRVAIYLADDSVGKIPVVHGPTVARLSVYPLEANNSWCLLDAVVWADFANNRAPVAHSSGVTVVKPPLTGTTGADNHVTVSFRPGSNSELHIENRTGSAQWFLIECSSLA